MATFIADTATAYFDVRMSDSARIEDQAKVSKSFLSGKAKISGNAKVSNVMIRDAVAIYDNAEVRGKMCESEIYGNIIMSDNCSIFGEAIIINNIEGNFAIIMKGNCKFGGNARTNNLITAEDYIGKYGSKQVKIKLEEEGSIFLRSTVTLTDIWDMGSPG